MKCSKHDDSILFLVFQKKSYPLFCQKFSHVAKKWISYSHDKFICNTSHKTLSPLNSVMSQDGGVIFHILTGTENQGINQTMSFLRRNAPKIKLLVCDGKKDQIYFTTFYLTLCKLSNYRNLLNIYNPFCSTVMGIILNFLRSIPHPFHMRVPTENIYYFPINSSCSPVLSLSLLNLIRGVLIETNKQTSQKLHGQFNKGC